MAALEARDPAPKMKPELSLTEKIVELYNSGKTYRQIAEVMDITLGIAANRIRHLLRDGVIQYRLPRKKNAPKPVAAGKDAHKKTNSNVIIPQTTGNVKTLVKPTLNTEGGTT